MNNMNTTPTYIFGEAGESHALSSVESAQAMAMGMLDKTAENPITLPVFVQEKEDSPSKLAFSVTTRRMVALLHVMGAKPNDDYSMDVDVTTAVLRLPYSEFQIFSTATMETSEVFSVLAEIASAVHDSDRMDVIDFQSLADTVCDYFGVTDTGLITPEAYAFAQKQHQHEQYEDVSVEVTVSLKVRIPKSKNIDDALNDMEYDFKLTHLGATILDTEITGYSHNRDQDEDDDGAMN